MSVDPLNQAEYRAITPILNVKNVPALAEFYTKTFGFEALLVTKDEKGNGFGEFQCRDSRFMIAEEEPENMLLAPETLKGTAGSLYVYVNDVDTFTASLKEKGVRIVQDLQDMPWGDRCMVALDPEGHSWMFATHKEDVEM